MTTALQAVGRGALLGWAVLRILPAPRLYARAALYHAYGMGVRSLPLVLVMAAVGGGIVAQQAAVQFMGGLPLWVVGRAVAAAIITEFGPVLTALVLVGRVGASIAAELGSMKVTEQIDALRAVGRDPVTFLVVPRVVAGLLVVPPLVVLANAVGILAGWGVGIMVVEGLTTSDFVFGMRFGFEGGTLVFSVLKGAAFGLAITFLACLIGLEGGAGAEGAAGAEGVGRTTTRAVVATTLAVMLLDLALVPLLRVL
jgi:phospholipid/cholesterol/gamma-HCH transport system permease protein